MFVQIYRQGPAVRQPHQDVRPWLDAEVFSKFLFVYIAACPYSNSAFNYKSLVSLMCLVVQALGGCWHAQVSCTEFAESAPQLPRHTHARQYLCSFATLTEYGSWHQHAYAGRFRF